MNTLNNNPEHQEVTTAQEKEDLGVLLFAFDNELIPYVEVARQMAKRIQRLWNLPVSIVTDDRSVYSDWPMIFDQVAYVDKAEVDANEKMFYDFDKSLSFFNGNRANALELTPYRRTIVLDVDYLVQTDDIPRLWNGEGLKLCRDAYSVFDYHSLSHDMRVLSGRSEIPMWWATVLCFDREAPETQRFFTEWKQALRHYRTLSDMYGFVAKPVRNDFAATIAVHRLTDNHYRDERFLLPHSIPTLMPHSEVTSIESDCMLVRNYEGGTTAVFSDLHIMNKKSLLSCLNLLPKES